MIRAGYNTREIPMHWETKLEELQKLAPVVFFCPQRARWKAQFLTMLKVDGENSIEAFPATEGATPGAAVTSLWERFVEGKSFIVITDGKPVRKVRYNARWEDLPLDEKQALVEAAAAVQGKDAVVDNQATNVASGTGSLRTYKTIDEPATEIFDSSD